MLIHSLAKQKTRLFFARIFAGAILFVWLGNSLPPLAAMTRHAESCRMDCCKSLKPHSAESCSGEMCPLMNEKPSSHEGSHEENESVDEHFAEHSSKFPIFGPESSGAHDAEINSLFFQLKTPEKCPAEMACITGGNSNFGQRQQQSSANSLLSFLILQFRPATFVSIDFESQESFRFIQQTWSKQTPSRGPPALVS